VGLGALRGQRFDRGDRSRHGESTRAFAWLAAIYAAIAVAILVANADPKRPAWSYPERT